MDDKEKNREEAKAAAPASASTENPATTESSAPPPLAETPSEAPVSFGEWLKGCRLKKKVSLEEIAAVTKVHIQQLRALEENDVAKLPAPAFVRGFLVSYARHLGLDENEVLERYKSSFSTLTPLADLLMPSASRAAQSPSSPKVRIVTSPNIKQAPSAREVEKAAPSFFNFRNTTLSLSVLGLLILVGALISLGKRSRNPHRPEVSTATSSDGTNPSAKPIKTAPLLPTPGPTKNATAPESPLPPSSQQKAMPSEDVEVEKAEGAKPVEAVASEPKKIQAEVKGLEQSWLTIRVDDGEGKGMVLKAGATFPIQADRRVSFTFSDAGGVEIKWMGTWYAAPGSRGDVRTLTLPDQLPQLMPKTQAVAAARAAAHIKPRAVAAPKPEENGAAPAAPAEDGTND